MNISDDLKILLKHLPHAIGVYRMFDVEQRLLYVGKAIDLNRRVNQYFRNEKALSPRILLMVRQVAHIEVTLTRSESEALILENNLIKSQAPKYNILFRDDKSYPFVRLSAHEFPRLQSFRGKPKSGGQNFGPYPNGYFVREALSILQKVFRLRTCEDASFRNRSRPCLLFQIARCSAPCTGEISREDYLLDVAAAAGFLRGKSHELLSKFQDSMQKCSDNLDFEKAAEFRDKIQALSQLQSQQFINSNHSQISADILALVQKNGQTCVNWVMIRHGQHRGDRSFFPENSEDESEENILQAFVLQHYSRHDLPPLILSNLKLPNRDEIFNWLKQGTPIWNNEPSGERKIWLEMAIKNAESALHQHYFSKNRQNEKITALQQVLDTPNLSRIECFDISHTQGEATYASCVVYDKKQMQPKEYRRFKLDPNLNGDDYAAMREALSRRYHKEKIGTEARLPDCVLIDGGIGQIGVAMDVLGDLEEMMIIGIAKGAARKAGEETLIIARTGEILELAPNNAAFHLLQEIRDEAHRFALSGHRAARAKNRQKSQLDDIPNIGSQRRRALIQHFGGLRGIRAASVDDLAQVKGISRKLAQTIFDFFHQANLH